VHEQLQVGASCRRSGEARFVEFPSPVLVFLALVKVLQQSGLGSRLSSGGCFFHHGAQGGQRFVQSFLPALSFFFCFCPITMRQLRWFVQYPPVQSLLSQFPGHSISYSSAAGTIQKYC
jgi:hypothetical protein